MVTTRKGQTGHTENAKNGTSWPSSAPWLNKHSRTSAAPVAWLRVSHPRAHNEPGRGPAMCKQGVRAGARSARQRPVRERTIGAAARGLTQRGGRLAGVPISAAEGTAEASARGPARLDPARQASRRRRSAPAALNLRAEHLYIWHRNVSVTHPVDLILLQTGNSRVLLTIKAKKI